MARDIIFMIEEDPEEGYTARALGYSIFTEADTWDDLKEAIQDAVWCHFEDDDTPSPGNIGETMVDESVINLL